MDIEKYIFIMLIAILVTVFLTTQMMLLTIEPLLWCISAISGGLAYLFLRILWRFD